MNKMEVFNELVKKEPNFLDRPIEELIPISYMGQAAVEFCRNKIKLMNKLGVAEEQKQATLKDGQDAGKMLLDIEARIGELIAPLRESPSEPIGAGRGNSSIKGSKPKPYPKTLTRRQRDTAYAVAKHPEAVAEVIKEAEENEDIPTKTAVLNKIRLVKAEKAVSELKGTKQPKPRPPLDDVVQTCIDNILDVNIVIEDILDNRDAVHPSKLTSLYKALRRLYGILSERAETWTREESTQRLLK